MREIDWSPIEAVLEAFWSQEANRAKAGDVRTAERAIGELSQVLVWCFDPSQNGWDPSDTANSNVNTFKDSLLTPESLALIRVVKTRGRVTLSDLSEALGLF